MHIAQKERGYIVKNTMSSIGSVKRGICEVENGYLKKLTESKVERKDGIIVAQPLSCLLYTSPSPRD